MDPILTYTVRPALATDVHWASTICDEMAASAQARGTGIARRSPEYVARKMEEGKAVIALASDGSWAGFCYIETWDGDYVANSGLIVSPAFRKSGLAKRIKEHIFALSRSKYPSAKIFGLTTGLAVMKINSDLGYEPVVYAELTQDESFWGGCKSCVNYEILMAKERKNCLCTAMLYDPADPKNKPVAIGAPVAKRLTPGERFRKKAKVYARFMRMKRQRLLGGRSLMLTLIPFFQPLSDRP